MSVVSVQDWQKLNQQSLMAALAKVRKALEHKAGQAENGKQPPTAGQEQWESSALEQLCHSFGLSTFERDLLLLCAGMELDASFASLCALAQGEPQKPYPTFSLALSALDAPHWNALTPNAPLRRWRLIEVGGGATLTQSPLRIDERILHYLAGVQHLDERLAGMIEPVRESSQLVPSHQHLAEQLAQTLSQAAGSERLLAVLLCGEDLASKRAIAAGACKLLGLSLHLVLADNLPSNANELGQFLRLWDREAVLCNSALVLDCDETDVERNGSAIARLIEQINSPLIVTAQERIRQRQRPLVSLDVSKPTHSEQYLLWEEALGAFAAELPEGIDHWVAQFNLNAPAIQATCASTLGQIEVEDNSQTLSDALWEACRAQARPRMEDLAQRIDAGASWDDLVLPEMQFQTLQAIIAHVRQRVKVYERWGFAGKGGRGLGISALFAGPSGTGKTTAAEVIARELNLDLYRIDLSAVVSKYIGETEKNLRRVFDAAEGGGAILLFDEADALFGKRSDVKDSHDRHANIEVSYLLQRMEAYRGLAILTTNLKGALDSAFLRRIRFVVQFSFPDAAQRAEIWRRIFPKETPLEGVDVNKLARLSVAGGNIRNIAMNAAFLAADANEAVTMKHLLSAARSESTKVEKPLTDSEVKGWVSS
ncbi:ATP-binding protein [Microcoleus sp. D3_18a_C4]|uniref:ATP-binding protein n=1 Tax=unclassified Microcoleus TaxID=2642155 RepID=UPI002FD4EE99